MCTPSRPITIKSTTVQSVTSTVHFEPEPRPLTSSELFRKVLLLVASWYASSITITFANKHILSGLNFRYPFFLTAVANSIASAEVYVVTRR